MTKEYYAQLSNFNLNIESLTGIITTGVLIASALILIVFAVLSVVLDHHWREHGVTKKQIRRLRQIYYGVSGILIFSMLISLIIFIL